MKAKRFVGRIRFTHFSCATVPLCHCATLLAAALLAILILPLMASACPGCKDALIEPGQLPQRLATARGFALSIGLMLLVPAALVASGIFFIARASRNAKS